MLTGIDLSPAMLQHARARASIAGLRSTPVSTTSSR
ncbi:MAG: class I SAM-dependent methyltransferase [Phycicoccus sp.]